MSKTKASPKMKELLAKVMGESKPMGEEEALANLAPEETPETEALLNEVINTVNVIVDKKVNESYYDQANAAGNTAAQPTMFVKAYDVTFNPETKRYMLHTIAYNDNGEVKYVGVEEFARYLPEVHSKLGKLFLDKLVPTMAPGYRVRK